MSFLQPQQFEQLSMFVSGRELRDDFQAGEGDKNYEGEQSSSVWRRKARDAGSSGLRDQIDRDGVTQPIEISHEVGDEGKKQVLNGHHRAAISHAQPDRLVPVLHHETEVGMMNPELWKAYPNI